MRPVLLIACMLQGLCTGTLVLIICAADADFQTWRPATASFTQPLSVGGGAQHGTASATLLCSDQTLLNKVQRSPSAALHQIAMQAEYLISRCAEPCYNCMVQGTE